MSHSKSFEKIKNWHSRKMWSKEQCANAVKKGIITAREFTEITGESYE